MKTAVRTRALLSAVPTPLPPAVLTVWRAGELLPALRVGGRELSREATPPPGPGNCWARPLRAVW